MKNDVEFKYAGGGFDVSHDPYTSSFGRPFRQEIRINCFSSGSKTFVKVPDIRNWEERDRFYGERQDVKMDAFLTERFAEIAQKVPSTRGCSQTEPFVSHSSGSSICSPSTMRCLKMP